MNLSLQPLRILVVDDDPVFLEHLCSSLSQRGYAVMPAHSAGEAVSHIQASVFDVVISDLKMPLMDGMSCLEIVKTIQPEIDFIMISGEGSIDDAVSAIQKGAVHFLQKPVQMEVLLRLLKKAACRAKLKLAHLMLEDKSSGESTLTMEEVLRCLCVCFDANAAAYWEVSGNTAEATQTVGYPAIGPPAPLQEAVLGWVRDIGQHGLKVGMLNCAKSYPKSANGSGGADFTLEHHVAIPIAGSEKLLGVVTLSRTRQTENFSASEIHSLKEIAARLAPRIAFLKLRASLDTAA